MVPEEGTGFRHGAVQFRREYRLNRRSAHGALHRQSVGVGMGVCPYGCCLPFGSIELPAPLGSIALPAPALTALFTLIALLPFDHSHHLRIHLAHRYRRASAVWIDPAAVACFNSCLHLHARAPPLFSGIENGKPGKFELQLRLAAAIWI